MRFATALRGQSSAGKTRPAALAEGRRSVSLRERESERMATSGKVLVTGASGHLGANLVRRLLSDGNDVRVLIRAGSDNSAVDGLPVERVYGDLRDAVAVDEAVRGCQRVFHVAARVSTLFGNHKLKEEIFGSNVLGTRHILESAMKRSVDRVVVTGSLSATGYNRKNPHEPSNETMPFYPFERTMAYETSKAHVEFEVAKAAAKGYDVCVATSCAILGPSDFKPSRMGRLLCSFANGKMLAYVQGGFEFVAARDIVEGHVLAMQKGQRGEKYIISSGYMEFDDLMGIFSDVTGQPRPRIALPAPVMQGIFEIVSPFAQRLAPKLAEVLTPGGMKILHLRRRADSGKAQRELGFRPTSIRQAVEEAYEFHVHRGAIKTAGAQRKTATPAAPYKNGASHQIPEGVTAKTDASASPVHN